MCRSQLLPQAPCDLQWLDSAESSALIGVRIQGAGDEGFLGRLDGVPGEGSRLVGLQDAFDLDARCAGAMPWLTVRVASR